MDLLWEAHLGLNPLILCYATVQLPCKSSWTRVLARIRLEISDMANQSHPADQWAESELFGQISKFCTLQTTLVWWLYVQYDGIRVSIFWKKSPSTPSPKFNFFRGLTSKIPVAIILSPSSSPSPSYSKVGPRPRLEIRGSVDPIPEKPQLSFALPRPVLVAESDLYGKSGNPRKSP